MRISDRSADVCSSDLLAHWITKLKKPSPRLPRVGRGRRHSRNGWQPKCLPAPSSAIRNGGQTASLGSTASDPRSRQPRAWTSNSSAMPPKCGRSEEHTSELQSLMRISYDVFRLKKKKKYQHQARKTNN